MDIVTQVKGLANLGMRILVGSMQYTLRRAKIERKFAPVATRRTFVPGAFKGADKIESGMKFSFENSELEIVFVLPGVPRLTWTPGELPLNTVVARSEFNPVQVAAGPCEEGFRLESGGNLLRRGQIGRAHV